LGAFLIRERKFSENKNAWLAAQWDANQSPPKFPANREFNREIIDFGVLIDTFGAEYRCAAATFRIFPYSH
jgi:hypothetical protein